VESYPTGRFSLGENRWLPLLGAAAEIAASRSHRGCGLGWRVRTRVPKWQGPCARGSGWHGWPMKRARIVEWGAAERQSIAGWVLGSGFCGPQKVAQAAEADRA